MTQDDELMQLWQQGVSRAPDGAEERAGVA